MKKTKNPKKVTAPLSYDPGKGRPKEHLAYLNWQEMQELQRINGGNMEFGPKGLPSFPPSGTTGKSSSSSSKGPSRGPTSAPNRTAPSTSRSTGPSRGPTSAPSRTAPSSSTGARPSTSTVGSGRGGGPSGGALNRGSGAGVGAQSRVAASQPGRRSTGPSSALNAPNRTQPSTDTKAKQQADSRNASSALRSNPSLKNDIRAGGINQIRVGPMGQPVDMGGRIKGAISQVASSPYRKVTPTSPGGGGMGRDNARRGSSTVAVISGMEAPGNIAVGSFYGEPPSRAARRDRLQADMDRYKLSQAYGNVKQITDRVPTYNYERPIGPNLPSKSVLSDQEMASRLAELNRIQSMPDWQFDENRYSWLKAPAGGPIGVPQKPAFDKYGALRAYESQYGPELAAARGSELERSLLAEANREVPAGGTFNKYAALRAYNSPYGPELAAARGSEIERQLLAGSEGTTQLKTAPEGDLAPIDLTQKAYIESQYPRLSREGGVGSLPVDYAPGERVLGVENVPFDIQRSRRGTEVVTNIFKTTPRTLASDLRGEVTDAINKYRNTAEGVPGPETPSVDLVDEVNASPSQGGLTKEQRDKAEADLKRAGAVVRVGGIAAGLTGGVPVSPVSNKAYKMYSEAKLKQLEDYAGMTMEQKAEAERKNPELIGWANRLSIPSASDSQTYRDWAQRSGLTGSGATTGGGLIEKFGIASLPAAQDSATRATPTTSTGGATDTGYTSGPRPYIYYQWDLGVNIPSPSDPKYTEYQKYLAGRAAASASYG